MLNFDKYINYREEQSKQMRQHWLKFIISYLHQYMIQQNKQGKQKHRQHNIDPHAYRLINGKYKIGPKIGEGSFGHVYYAQDLCQNPFAIKISDLKPKIRSGSNIQQIVKRLSQEDQSMMACKSEFLMRCFGGFNDEKRNLKYIVMQLCNFGSLQDLLYLKGHLAEEQARIIIKQIFCGLSQMHRRGRIHRDIKSSNVCFDKDHSVLCDFGCSKLFLNLVQKQDWRVTVKKSGTILGTILSKSPEMMSGQKYGLRTDIWAMGILFYEMITGIPPFFFSNDLSDVQAVQFIKDNINNIYDEDYIKNNLKRYEMLERGNFKINKNTKIFMQKLIVFDQNQRFGWKNLSIQEYLLKDCIKQGWEMAQCILPLKDIPWQKFIKSIEVLTNDQQKIQVPKISEAYKAQNIEVQPIDLPKKEQLKLFQNSKFINQMQQKSLDEIKIMHFQIRRLNMLMNLRGYLGQLQSKHPKLKCDKVGLMISKFCYLKLKQIQKSVKQNKIGFIQNVGMEPLINLIFPIYREDKKVFERDHTGFLSQIKSLAYDENKVQFYQNIKKQNIEVVLEHICQQTNKLLRKIKEITQMENIDFVEFFEFPRQILQASYEPNQKDKKSGCWRRWVDLGCILQFTKQKKS